jgi:hypothetical protein
MRSWFRACLTNAPGTLVAKLGLGIQAGSVDYSLCTPSTTPAAITTDMDSALPEAGWGETVPVPVITLCRRIPGTNDTMGWNMMSVATRRSLVRGHFRYARVCDKAMRQGHKKCQ